MDNEDELKIISNIIDTFGIVILETSFSSVRPLVSEQQQSQPIPSTCSLLSPQPPTPLQSLINLEDQPLFRLLENPVSFLQRISTLRSTSSLLDLLETSSVLSESQASTSAVAYLLYLFASIFHYYRIVLSFSQLRIAFLSLKY